MHLIQYLFFTIILNFTVKSVESFILSREHLLNLFPQYPILHRVKTLKLKNELYRGFKNPISYNFIGLVGDRGYMAEEHYVTTADGYHLTFHRIPGGEKFPPKSGKPIVLLQHGFLGSSDYWMISSRKNNLAFLLSDNGYDVWVSNIRGNSYSRSHETLSTLDAKFWQFSYHEPALYDLPAIIDYALNATGENDIFYIGHSMGTTMSYALLARKPEYNNKIRLAISLAPVAFWKKVPPYPAWQFLLKNFDIIKDFLDKNEIYDVLPLSDNFVKFAYGFCGTNLLSQAMCLSTLFLFSGSNPDQFDISLLPDILSQLPAGTSTQIMDHFKQNAIQGIYHTNATNSTISITDRLIPGQFQQYDYNCAKNKKKCGKKPSLQYNLKKITAPFALIYSTNDAITLEENVLELAKNLPNVIEMYKIPDRNFNHVDYLWGRDAKVLINDKILEIMSKY